MCYIHNFLLVCFFFVDFKVADALGLDKVNVNVSERRSDTESSVR